MYKIPDAYFFRLHHVRPRFKSNVEEVLLYVANSIANLENLPAAQFNAELNQILKGFERNALAAQKTIDNWRTEISALFGFIQEYKGTLFPGRTARRLAENQYLDEFFNYFLYSFQYPGGHLRSDSVIRQINVGIRFRPCQYILQILLAGEELTGKPFSITAEELTYCAYFDLRVTRDHRPAVEVAALIHFNREHLVGYDHHYEALRTKDGGFPSKGDICRYAGDMLDYMVLADLLNDKGSGYYYYLSGDQQQAIDYHLQVPTWFPAYDPYYDMEAITDREIRALEDDWFAYVNSFDHIEAFMPKLDQNEKHNISQLVLEYYNQLSGGRKVPSKVFGDYGETLIIAHEFLRTRERSKRQHLIQKIPTQLGVGYDIQSIEEEKGKRYIEVKTTKSKKALNNNRFRLTPNEWDTAETMGERYFIYYLVVNAHQKNIFVIQDPLRHYAEGNLKVDQNLVVEFNQQSGKWQQLLETEN